MNHHPGIIGIKLGMTQVHDDEGSLIPCTVILSGCRVVGKRTEDKDGYNALILGVGDKKEKRASKALRTAMEKVGQKVPRFTRELRLSGEQVAAYEVGQVLKLEEIFEEGQLVDVQSTSKGHGFTGVVRRHNFRGVNQTHGTHEWRRHGGSIGTNMTPGRTLPGRKMAGQMGNVTTSVLNQRVVKIIADQQLLLLGGSVPGARNGMVRVQGAVKRRGGKKKS
jgi:large subunit ribosomal protein L3